MAQRSKRYSVYDVMEAQGVFDRNPANASARDEDTSQSLYKGPVEYPKMLYHPNGELRVIVEANFVPHPLYGTIETDKQVETIYKIVHTAEEEAELVASGWHKSLAASVAARTGEAVPKTSAELIAEREAEITRLKTQLAGATAAQQAVKTQAAGPSPLGKK